MDDDVETKPPNMEQLASEYMDLWQKQLAAVASDEVVASMMVQTAELINNSAAAVAAMSTKPTRETPDDRKDDAASPPPTTTAGATPTSSSHGHADNVVQQLTRRIERLEERISDLEAASRSDSQ